MTEKQEKIAQALDEVRDAHIEEAAKPKNSRTKWVLRLSAAAAAVAVMIGVLLSPSSISAEAISLPEQRRDTGDYQTVRQARSELTDFFAQGSEIFLSDSENSIWSPINAFMGLCMVAELAEGESRQQILELFGAQDLQALRTYATNIWEFCYHDGKEICTLANSLWLDDDVSYDQQAMDDLAYYYYASVYRGTMGSKALNTAVAEWLDQNTGGLLKVSTKDIDLPASTIFALYSTVYLQGTWVDEFNKANNTDGIFYGYAGESTVTYMNDALREADYYWGEHCSAVTLSLKNGTTMWFILPDEGYTTADVLAEGEYMQMICGDWENYGNYLVNFSVPKFDISYRLDLADGLREMGVTDVFDGKKADFSGITDTAAYLSAANQSVRVVIDEEGVKAAAYIELPAPGASAPPSQIIDFVLDRPFVFVISGNADIPLFVGTVNQP